MQNTPKNFWTRTVRLPDQLQRPTALVGLVNNKSVNAVIVEAVLSYVTQNLKKIKEENWREIALEWIPILNQMKGEIEK